MLINQRQKAAHRALHYESLDERKGKCSENDGVRSQQTHEGVEKVKAARRLRD